MPWFFYSVDILYEHSFGFSSCFSSPDFRRLKLQVFLLLRLTVLFFISPFVLRCKRNNQFPCKGKILFQFLVSIRSFRQNHSDNASGRRYAVRVCVSASERMHFLFCFRFSSLSFFSSLQLLPKLNLKELAKNHHTHIHAIIIEGRKFRSIHWIEQRPRRPSRQRISNRSTQWIFFLWSGTVALLFDCFNYGNNFNSWLSMIFYLFISHYSIPISFSFCLFFSSFHRLFLLALLCAVAFSL